MLGEKPLFRQIDVRGSIEHTHPVQNALQGRFVCAVVYNRIRLKAMTAIPETRPRMEM